MSFGLQPSNIAAHVSALSQLSSAGPANKRTSQAIFSACLDVLDSHIKGTCRVDQKTVAALYTISKVKTVYFGLEFGLIMTKTKLAVICSGGNLAVRASNKEGISICEMTAVPIHLSKCCR